MLSGVFLHLGGYVIGHCDSGAWHDLEFYTVGVSDCCKLWNSCLHALSEGCCGFSNLYAFLIASCTYSTQCTIKHCHFCFYNNFDKCRPVLIILSL